jgi:hypothetical protein
LIQFCPHIIDRHLSGGTILLTQCGQESSLTCSLDINRLHRTIGRMLDSLDMSLRQI